MLYFGFFTLFGLTMMFSTFVIHFGKPATVIFIFRKILSGEISIKQFFKEEILEMTATSLLGLLNSFVSLFISFGIFIWVLFPYYQESILTFFTAFIMFVYLLGMGIIFIFRKDTGGLYPWRGSLAVFAGWVIVVCSFMFALYVIWELFISI